MRCVLTAPRVPHRAIDRVPVAGNGSGMSVVKINAVTVPSDQQARFEERFRGRAGAVEKTPRLRVVRAAAARSRAPTSTSSTPAGRSEEAYQAWQSGQDFDRAHDGGGDTLAPAASASHHLWSYEVLESAGPHAG